MEFVTDPKLQLNLRGNMFRRNYDGIADKDLSDEWTDFVYRKRLFYQDYYSMVDMVGKGYITTGDITCLLVLSRMGVN